MIVSIGLVAALSLLFVTPTNAATPDIPVETVVHIGGEKAWLGDFCMQTTGAIYVWDRPVCGTRSECQSGGLIITLSGCEGGNGGNGLGAGGCDGGDGGTNGQPGKEGEVCDKAPNTMLVLYV